MPDEILPSEKAQLIGSNLLKHCRELLTNLFDVQIMCLSNRSKVECRVAMPLYRFNVLGDSILSEIVIRRYRKAYPDRYLITIERSNQNIRTCLSSRYYFSQPDEVMCVTMTAMNVWNRIIDNAIVDYLLKNNVTRLLIINGLWMDYYKDCPFEIDYWNLWETLRIAASHGDYPNLPIPGRLESWASEFLNSIGISRDSLLFAMHVRDEIFHPYKNLDIGKYAQIVETLIKDYNGYVFLIGDVTNINGLPVEIRELMSIDFPLENPRLFDLRKYSFSVLELGALIAKAHLYIGGDTGPTHLAAAVRVPIIAADYCFDTVGPFTHEENYIKLLRDKGKLESEYIDVPIGKIYVAIEEMIKRKGLRNHKHS
jgi:hypothetical protein